MEDMMVRLSRRTMLLTGSAWAFAGFGARFVGAQGIARPSLPIPPELRADAAGSIKLNARTGTMRFWGDRETATYGINGPYLGPALRLRRGETVTVQVTNNVPENITMHWHGLIIPGAADGGPHQHRAGKGVADPTLDRSTGGDALVSSSLLSVDRAGIDYLPSRIERPLHQLKSLGVEPILWKWHRGPEAASSIQNPNVTREGGRLVRVKIPQTRRGAL
jgi:Multicopper oxidase